MRNSLVGATSRYRNAVGGGACFAFWRYVSKADWKWFWLGAGLRIVAVIIKRIIGLSINAAVIGWLKHHLPYASFVAASGVFIGVESSVCEIGVTLLEV